jgi:hypothetical protein
MSLNNKNQIFKMRDCIHKTKTRKKLRKLKFSKKLNNDGLPSIKRMFNILSLTNQTPKLGWILGSYFNLSLLSLLLGKDYQHFEEQKPTFNSVKNQLL